jgi:hypothetical protein
VLKKIGRKFLFVNEKTGLNVLETFREVHEIHSLKSKRKKKALLLRSRIEKRCCEMYGELFKKEFDGNFHDWIHNFASFTFNHICFVSRKKKKSFEEWKRVGFSLFLK